MDYEEYEKLSEKEIERNEQFLEMFQKHLESKGLTKKTINRHMFNVDYYINTYLMREDIIPMEQGPDHISMFLGYYFIRKCMWSTPGSIKTYAASLKKFYGLMAEKGFISKKDYDLMLLIIKEEMDVWQYDCSVYNDGGSPFFY